MIAASANDYRILAKRRLPRFLFDYVDGGSYAEATLRANVADLEALALRQRVLNDVSAVDTATTILGERASLPFGLGPIGLGGLNARRGETQAVRATDRAGIPFCLSTLSACSIAEVAGAATRPFWFQLYVLRDRAFVRDLVAQASAHGCTTLVFTVDLPMPGARYRDYRSGLAGAPGLRRKLQRAMQVATRPAWAIDVGLRGRPLQPGNVAPIVGEDATLDDYNGWIGRNFDPSTSWKELEQLRAEWPGKLIVKGILDAEDAREARRGGADGIVVSNHGGRQLDGVLSTARALPAIVDAVGADLAVLADGGVRSGLDVVRMLALGADFVLLGRAWVYALAGAGEAGVAHVIRLFESEIRIAMALTGRTSIAAIDRMCLAA